MELPRPLARMAHKSARAGAFAMGAARTRAGSALTARMDAAGAFAARVRLAGALLAAILAACAGFCAGAAAADAPARRALDQTGHALALPAEVMRVGTPGISMASLIVVLAGPAKLAAATPEVRDNPWLRRIAPALAQLPVPFTRPAGVNVESLLAARPDLVTLWLGNAALAARIEDVGIPVFTLGYATPDEMRRAVLLLGRALGPKENARAEEFVRYYDANLARVAQGLAGLAANARPRVYYASIDPLYTEGRDSMIDAWIDAAGGVNVAARAGVKADGWVQLEDVLAWNPEIIVTLGEAQRRAILADPRWQRIAAVRRGRVYVNPRGVNAWCTRAAETALQVLWAAKTFHPERFAALDIGAATRDFYRRFYGYALDDDELARVLAGLPPSDAPVKAGAAR